MDLLDEYFKAKSAVHKYFGYKEDWVSIPLDDATGYYWILDGDGYGGRVRFATTIDDLKDEESGNYFANDIYTQRFLPRWVYPGEKYTMICVDTRTDGNKFLQIFSNDMEIKE